MLSPVSDFSIKQFLSGQAEYQCINDPDHNKPEIKIECGIRWVQSRSRNGEVIWRGSCRKAKARQMDIIYQHNKQQTRVLRSIHPRRISHHLCQSSLVCVEDFDFGMEAPHSRYPPTSHTEAISAEDMYFMWIERAHSTSGDLHNGQWRSMDCSKCYLL